MLYRFIPDFIEYLISRTLYTGIRLLFGALKYIMLIPLIAFRNTKYGLWGFRMLD